MGPGDRGKRPSAGRFSGVPLVARRRRVAGALVAGTARNGAAMESSWNTVLGTTAGAGAAVCTARPIEVPRLCAIGSTRGVSARNVNKGATCRNELTGVAAALEPRVAKAESTSESTTAGSEETAGCAPFETMAIGGVPPGPGSVDAPAG